MGRVKYYWEVIRRLRLDRIETKMDGIVRRDIPQHFGYVEDIGLGIPDKIIKLMKEHSGKEPELKEIGEEFIVNLFPAQHRENITRG